MRNGETRDGLLIERVTIVAGGSTTEDGWIRFERGLVAARGSGVAPSFEGEVIDGGGAMLVPGFVDLHVHGGGGAAVSDGAHGLAAMLRAHRTHGTTRTVLSLVSEPVDELADTVRALSAAVQADPLVLGIHLEGPFLNPDAKGAHDPEALSLAAASDVEALLTAADGTLTQVTLSPELPGALDAIRSLVAANVRVAVGHTTADIATAHAAFDAGASLLTHAFNAMPVLGHRAPGPVGAALNRSDVVLELIADGLHVHPILIAALFRLAPRRIALVTDAMAAAGMGDGSYRLGPFDVEVRGGAARLPNGTIAGSTLTVDRAIRTAVGAGVPLADAVLAATATPARAVGRPDLGTLEIGSTADAVLLDEDLTVQAVWADGVRLASTADETPSTH